MIRYFPETRDLCQRLLILIFCKKRFGKSLSNIYDKNFLKKQPMPWKQATIGNNIAKKITKSTRKDQIKPMCPLK